MPSLLAELEIPARAEFVSLARLVVGSIADDRYELTDDQLDNLKLAVSEACVMVIGSDGTRDGNIAIECAGAPDHLDVVVDGRGSQFSAGQIVISPELQHKARDLEQELGLPLIGSLVDGVEVEKFNGGNRLRMTVRCERAEEL